MVVRLRPGPVPPGDAQARANLEALEIDGELRSTVAELIVDDGLQVHQECAPVWDGEDDPSDGVSPADLDRLPRLGRVVSTVPLAEDLREALGRRGVVMH
ncbi:DUF6892 domain-containing protein [Streptomyces sp. NPDC060188]|uniref:DUF6892 domain-containing protein n=1 Tax=Streptomyces sp. NPDC060188 TaxID=3347068 RepID=UPI00364DA14C